jgi:glycosyltransferase involved in cell wall biosynthesis
VTHPTLLHFAESGDSSGLFPALARWRDRDKYRMIFGTLLPLEPSLRQFMDSQGVECLSLGSPNRLAYPAALASLAIFLHDRRVDILHTHLFDPTVVGMVAGSIARTPLRVITRHYSDYHTRIHKTWHTGLDRLSTHLADRVIAVSQHTADHLIGVEGAPPSKVRVVPNGVDVEKLKVSPDAAARLRQELQLDDQRILLVPARLHPEKGLEYLFQALPVVRRQSQVRFVILVAGSGPFLDHYRGMVRELGCEDVVRFLGFRRDLADLMSAAYLVVLPSVAEAFGIALVEALYLGVPVVSTRVGGVPEILMHGVDSLLVPPADPGALSDAIAQLLNDPQERNRLAGAGQQRMAQLYSFERMVKGYEAVYAAAGF